MAQCAGGLTRSDKATAEPEWSDLHAPPEPARVSSTLASCRRSRHPHLFISAKPEVNRPATSPLTFGGIPWGVWRGSSLRHSGTRRPRALSLRPPGARQKKAPAGWRGLRLHGVSRSRQETISCRASWRGHRGHRPGERRTHPDGPCTPQPRSGCRRAGQRPSPRGRSCGRGGRCDGSRR